MDTQNLANHVVLTRSGRTALEQRLTELEERQRRLADWAPSDLDHESISVGAQIHRLRATLERAAAPASVMDDPRIVELGDVVTLRHEDGSTERVTLTNSIEATAADSHVSVTSPLGLALEGRAVGDQVIVHAPGGRWGCTIVRRSRAK